MSDSGIDKIRKSLGHAAEEAGNPVRFFMPEWLRAWARYSSGVLDAEGEIDSPEADSPWLEEKRKWSALRERSRYETEIGRLVPIDAVHKGYGVVASNIRRSGEAMCESCKGLLDAALDDADADVDRVFNDSDSEEPNE